MNIQRQFIYKRMALLLSLVLLLLNMTGSYHTVVAEESILSGNSGSISWKLDTLTKRLTIEGSGTLGSVSALLGDNSADVQEVIVGEGITELDKNVFGGGNGMDSQWKSLQRVVLPEGITVVPGGAFHNCPSLQEVVLPNGVKAIGDYAFAKCGELQLQLPEGLEYIGNYAFMQCEIGILELPDSVQHIGNSAFAYCSNLTEAVLPDGLQYIGSSAFLGCSNLTKAVLPDGLRYIGGSAFWGCSHLTDVNLPAGLGIEDLSASIFYGCDALKDADGFVIINGVLFAVDNTKETIVVPKDVKYIASGAFGYSIEKVTLPDGMETISPRAFSALSKLTEVDIPETVKTIEASAFYNCRSLAGIELPDGLSSVGDYAFSGCSALASVTLPTSLQSIGKSAFSGCSALTEITIPSGVSTIGDWAFFRCDQLTSVSMPEKIENIGTDIFSDCKGLLDEHGTIVINNILYGDWNDAIDKETGDYTQEENFVYISKDVKDIAIELPTKVVIDKRNAYFDQADDGSVYSLSGRTLIKAAPKSHGDGQPKTMVVRYDCKRIKKGALSDCAYNCELTIPPTVLSINSTADFSPGKDSKTSVVIKGVKGSYAEQYARRYRYSFIAIDMYAPGKGDMNADGRVTLSDARALLQDALHIRNMAEDEDMKERADVDGNGSITLADAESALKGALHVIDLPQGEKMEADGTQYTFDEDPPVPIVSPWASDSSLTWTPWSTAASLSMEEHNVIARTADAPSTDDITDRGLACYMVLTVASSMGVVYVGCLNRKKRKQT